ncbi:hypothetical protein Tco_1428350 [Tanacetum coccineum]
MSTPVNTSSTDSQMHNNIMAAGSKDRPPMLGPGRYSHTMDITFFPNGYLFQAVPELKVNPAFNNITANCQLYCENMDSREQRTLSVLKMNSHFLAIITGIGDEIYQTVDARQTQLNEIRR